MFLIELTVPYESRVGVQHQFKMAKYEDLAKELQSKGYTTKVMPVEVGARGFVSASIFKLMGQLGIKERKRSSVIKRISEVAEKSSHWIWLKRSEKMGF